MIYYKVGFLGLMFSIEIKLNTFEVHFCPVNRLLLFCGGCCSGYGTEKAASFYRLGLVPVYKYMHNFPSQMEFRRVLYHTLLGSVLHIYTAHLVQLYDGVISCIKS